MAWRAANCLLRLQDAFNAAYPHRNKSIGPDAFIGDEAHAERKSDHNPNSAGVVLAYDISNDPAHGCAVHKIADYMIAHPDARCRYIISNRRIAGDQGFVNGNYPGKRPWTWLPYNGTNPHDMHIHVSAEKTAALYDDSRPWDIGPVLPSQVTSPTAGLSVQPDVLRRGSLGDDVSVLQWLLRVAVDADFGINTEAAVKAFQQKQGLTIDGVVGEQTWDKIQGLFPPPVVVPVPPVTPPAAGVQQNIVATVFGGGSDPQKSAYDGHLVTDSELAVALPYHFTGVRPKVKVTNRANGDSGVGTIEDIGPWNTNDPYWKTNSRPQAESGTDMTGRHTNHAGIDLSPALARELGVDGKGVVDWEFIS